VKSTNYEVPLDVSILLLIGPSIFLSTLSSNTSKRVLELDMKGGNPL
jgi:hypothetical protein